MKVEYDREADAIYMSFSNKPYAFGEDLDRERRIDYSADGSPIGLELTCVGSGVLLDNLPYRDEIAAELDRLEIRVLV